jgi:pantetheine-phosphate adenylyltransferase
MIQRAARIVDELDVAILINSAKKPLFTLEERLDMLNSITKDMDNVKIVSFSVLSIDYAKEIGANLIVRGLRAITDFDYELQIAHTNRIVNPEIDTMFLTTNLKYGYLSSTIVREIASYGGDITRFVPEELVNIINDKFHNKQGGIL